MTRRYVRPLTDKEKSSLNREADRWLKFGGKPTKRWLKKMRRQARDKAEKKRIEKELRRQAIIQARRFDLELEQGFRDAMAKEDECEKAS